jgi:protein-disulfide isomerase
VDPVPATQPSAFRTVVRQGRLYGVTLLVAGTLVTAGCSGGDPADESAATTPSPTATQTGADTPSTAAPAPIAKTVARVRRELRGIPQRGLVLGSPTAPVTIVEYGHFECPTCAAAHGKVLPAVIERFVRTGKASLELRPLGGSPSRSRDLAIGAYAASAQRRGWDFTQLAYLRSLQGSSSDSPAELAAALGLDEERWGDEIANPKWPAQVTAAGNVAAAARFSTYPVFLVRARARPGQPFVVLTNPGSVRAFGDAIAKAEKPGG